MGEADKVGGGRQGSAEASGVQWIIQQHGFCGSTKGLLRNPWLVALSQGGGGVICPQSENLGVTFNHTHTM